MDPANPFSDYHSAYRGIVNQADGNFSHLVRTLDVSHLHGGYWRYLSVQDDRLAMAYGFEKPEDLLVAVETSTDCEEYDKITLLWMKGSNDLNLRGVLSGTASQHLRIIHEIRQLLGLPMSSRGQVPIYPISMDMRLKLYWDRMYEKPSSTSTVRPFDVVNQAMLSLAPRPSTAPQPLMAPQPPAMVLQPLPSTHLRFVSAVRPYHQHMNPYGLREGSSTSSATAPSRLPFSNPNAMAAASQQPLPTYPSFNHREISGNVNAADAEQPSSSAASSLLPRSAPANVNNPIPSPHTAVTRHPAETQPQPPFSSGGLDPEQLDEDVCIWCEKGETHDNDCPLGNLNFHNDCTFLDYSILTDAVEQFDPGPWTVHFDQFPEPELEDSTTQIAGMAEIIRGEESYRNDAKLHGLRDEHLVMLWALKTCKGVEVIDEPAESS